MFPREFDTFKNKLARINTKFLGRVSKIPSSVEITRIDGICFVGYSFMTSLRFVSIGLVSICFVSISFVEYTFREYTFCKCIL
jgi:hypothetical protein